VRYRAEKWAVCVVLMVDMALAATVAAQSSPQKRWTVDLESLWGLDAPSGDCKWSRPAATVASSNGVVAVGIQKACILLSAERKKSRTPPLRRSLIFFLDPTTGHVLAKYEPPSNFVEFGLFPASGGNFILGLRRVEYPARVDSNLLVLISPAGEKIVEANLAVDGLNSGKGGWQIFISPTRKTMVVMVVHEFRSDPKAFAVIDTDTLTVRDKWKTQDTPEPSVLCSSDTMIVGIARNAAAAQSPFPSEQHFELNIKSFDDPWHVFPGVASSATWGTQCAFLSEDVIAKSESTGRWQNSISKAGLALLRPNGEVIATMVLKKSSRNHLVVGGIITSSSGSPPYFAVQFTSVSRFWEALDAYRSRVEILVLRARDLEPMWRVDAGGSVSDFCFSPEGSELYFVDRKRLVAYELPLAFSPAPSK
jgi:hypothetical protein